MDLKLVGEAGLEPAMPLRTRFTVWRDTNYALPAHDLSKKYRTTGLPPVGTTDGFGCAHLTIGLSPPSKCSLIYAVFSHSVLLRDFLFGRDIVGYALIDASGVVAGVLLLNYHPSLCHPLLRLYRTHKAKVCTMWHTFVWLYTHYPIFFFQGCAINFWLSL